MSGCLGLEEFLHPPATWVNGGIICSGAALCKSHNSLTPSNPLIGYELTSSEIPEVRAGNGSGSIY